MNVHMLSAVIGCGLAVWGGAVAVMPAGKPVALNSPGWTGRTVNAVEVDVPPILSWQAYYPNNKNPFVPGSQRLIEEHELERPPDTPRKIEKLRPFTTPQTQPRVIPKPVFTTPRAKASPEAPQVIGVIQVSDHNLRVTLAIHGRIEVLRPGQEVDGWRLDSVVGELVYMKSPDGKVVNLPISVGDNSTTLQQSAVPAPSGPADLPDGVEMPRSDDPELQAALDDMKRNPGSIRKYMSDPNLSARLLMEPSVQKFLEQTDGGRSLGR